MEQYPDYVQEQFPFILTKRNGLHKDVAHMLTTCLMHGQGFKAMEAQLRESALLQYHKLQKQYYSLAERHLQLQPPAKFSPFEDTGGFAGACPSATYLQDIWLKWFTEVCCLQTELRTLVDGTIFAGDASFKYAKIVRLRAADTGPSSDASLRRSQRTRLFTIMNEFGEVVWQCPMKTASLNELKDELKMLFVNRFRGHGFNAPAVFYTDKCCDDRHFLQQLF
ncbi:unnamed protein product, partial [Chrysoparadoxa australica]